MIKENRYKQCNVCGIIFRCRNRFEIHNRKFCSVKCQHKWLGKKLSKDRKGNGNPMFGKTGWNKGMKMSKEHCKKLSKAHKGLPSYWKNKKRPEFSKKWKENISKGLKGRKITWKNKLKVPKSEEHKRKIALAKLGSKNPAWKGGNYVDYSKSPEYKRWAKKVKERDNYTCQKCGKVGGYIDAHHIKNKKDYPELMLIMSNGQTLCKKCHKKIHYKH